MANHPNPNHQRDSIAWAKSVLEQPERYVILDTETTGVTSFDEVIQIGVIDPLGTVLLDHLVKPARKKQISSEAMAIHRITMAMLANKPLYSQIAGMLESVVRGRTVITYNAEFDRRLLMQSAEFAGGFVPPEPWECAMLQYSQFVGDWDTYRNAYRWQKLWGGDHTAVGDCRATLARITEMAEGVTPSVRKDNSRLNRGKDITLTLEQFATAQISVEQCMRCPRVKGKEEYGSWRYFRYDGNLTVLCPDCFRSLTGGRTPPLEVLAFYEKVSELCAYPIWEDAYKPAERVPLEWIEFALANLRDMTPDDLSRAENDCLREPPDGQPDQRRSPLDARKVLRVLRYIKEASEGTVTKMLRMWEGVDNLIAGWMEGEHYDPYRSRVKEVAFREILFGVNIFLSDQIGKARERADKKKTKTAKEKVFQKAIQDVSRMVPPESLPGVAEDVKRFVEFIEAEIAGLGSDKKAK
jgi:DNA polymerase-3 subunit epsilon